MINLINILEEDNEPIKEGLDDIPILIDLINSSLEIHGLKFINYSVLREEYCYFLALIESFKATRDKYIKHFDNFIPVSKS